MKKVRLFIVPKHMRTHNSFQFRIKMREEIGVTEQKPIKKEDIVKFHAVKHDKKARKETEKSVIVSYAVPKSDSDSAREKQNGKFFDNPPQNMRPRKAFLFIGNRRKIFFRRGGKKSLILNKSHAAV